MTLRWCIETCISQNYRDMTILVSDNSSSDSTQSVVESFDDPRVVYVNTGKAVSMSENWEFALAHVKDGFVTFIGDDDGLMPCAIENLVNLLMRTDAQAIAWMKAEYLWPDHPSLSNRNNLLIPPSNELIRVSAKSAIRDATKLLLPYNRLPCLYNGLVSMTVINKVKIRTGYFFGSMTPDVYSGLAVLSELSEYFYSSRPFSVNGASGKGNGATFVSNANSSSAKEWLENVPMCGVHQLFQPVPGSVYSTVLEAYAQANQKCFADRLKISPKVGLRRVISEVARLPKGAREKVIPNVASFADRLGLDAYYQKMRTKFFDCTDIQRIEQKGARDEMVSNGLIRINLISTSIDNISAAADFLALQIGSYVVPEKIKTYSFLMLLLSNRLSDFVLFERMRAFIQKYRLI